MDLMISALSSSCCSARIAFELSRLEQTLITCLASRAFVMRMQSACEWSIQELGASISLDGAALEQLAKQQAVLRLVGSRLVYSSLFTIDVHEWQA